MLITKPFREWISSPGKDEAQATPHKPSSAAQRRQAAKAAAKSAHDRTRTCTPFPALVPQTSLSTNSSTWATAQDQNRPNLNPSQIGRKRSTITGMLGEGLEPSRGCPHRILNPARLPIPPPEPLDPSRAESARRSRCRLEPINGAEGSRTPDLLNAIQALSQLSYSPITRKLTLVVQSAKERG